MIKRSIADLERTIELNTSGAIINYDYGFPEMSSYIKIRPNRNLIYAGEPKSGKTRKVMRKVFNLLYKYSNVFVNLFTFEILGQDIVLAELCHLLNSYEDTILNGRYDDNFKTRLIKAKSLINGLKMDIYEKSLNLNQMETIMRNSAEQLDGKLMKCTERTSNGKEERLRYPLLINVIDHSRLVHREKDDEITHIQKLSRLMNTIRNDYSRITFNIIISQYTRGISSREASKDSYEPRLSDLFGGSAVEQDANYVIGMANPFRNKVSDYYGYDVTKLKQYLRVEHVLANRHGNSDVMVGLLCNFAKSSFYEISADQFGKKTFNNELFEKFITNL